MAEDSKEHVRLHTMAGSCISAVSWWLSVCTRAPVGVGVSYGQLLMLWRPQRQCA